MKPHNYVLCVRLGIVTVIMIASECENLIIKADTSMEKGGPVIYCMPNESLYRMKYRIKFAQRTFCVGGSLGFAVDGGEGGGG